MQEIKCLEWRPFSGSTLAVASKYGICLWTIKTSKKLLEVKDTDIRVFTSGGGQESWMTLLSHPGQQNVVSLSWSPCGSYLAAICDGSNSLFVWEISTQKCTSFVRLDGPILGLKWSPNGEKLAIAVPSYFRIWNTLTWTSSHVSCNGLISCFEWMPDSQNNKLWRLIMFRAFKDQISPEITLIYEFKDHSKFDLGR
ncbi:hypothetical protein O9G_006063, partial [Rozella allomycis CSF55]